MISNNQPSSSRTAVDANTTQSSQRTITHDAEDDLASDDKRELTREMMIVAESEATVAEKKDDDDNCLEMNGIQFLKLHKGLLTISRYIDIIDKCQGRELSFFHINGLIEQIVNSKTDMHHGGQFLHVFWNLSKLLSRIRDLQMNIEFLFFEQDEVYTWLDVMEIDRMKTQEGLKSMTYSISEGVEILEQSIYRDDYMVSVKLPLSKVESPKWKPLLKELLRMYLSNNGFVCHTFKNMCDAKFLQLLRQREPGFILAQRNDHLFKSLCIFVGRFVGDSLNFGSNTCYSYVSGTSFSSTLECPCFVDVMDKIQEQGNAALSEKKAY
ncbi:hypothetical protein FDP41_004221 [Naegleria fowleri]|uniref:Uncharacterized protein n=1 Tax=Naegleria fowleri TaxID=5763 RepID=A0A6A5BPI8_NAEFO|nr:uncharacterized protein FDP41_004221 [Naegleria fowleri]KAF0976926.1 hypothetical protein FDP41_004221 [Naegleria fowleri]